MAKIKVISPFCDKYNHAHTFKVGDILDFEEGRAKDVISRNLAVTVEDAPAPADADDEAAKAKAQKAADKAADALKKAEDALSAAKVELNGLKGDE